ncbi:exocyst complex component 3-like protein 4 isoform X2 [Engraulis encrasicolus]
MQIHKLIECEVLEEAHLNLLSLREEFIRQQGELEKLQRQQADRSSSSSPETHLARERAISPEKHLEQDPSHPQQPVSPEEMTSIQRELSHLQKDLQLLYRALRDKMAAIVRESSALPARNKELLVGVCRVVQEEERRERGGQAGGLGGWREAWREAVTCGVRQQLAAVHLDTPEHNTSWLAVHLGLLGKAIVEHLERVKAELQDSYPPTFRVFDTYVTSCHVATEEHLQRLMGRVTQLKDLHALLDFITHRYKSERIMGSFSLRPEMKEEQRELKLQEAFNADIRKAYATHTQAELRNTLERVCVLEREECWEEQLQPQVEDGILQSHLTMDISTNVKSYVVNARRIDADLEQRVTHTCLAELTHFPRRLESEFLQWSSSLLDSRMWVDYSITYINTFTQLREHMEGYRDNNPHQMSQLCRELEWSESRLRESILQHFLIQAKPLLRRMCGAKWLSTDEDFDQLISRIQELKEHNQQLMTPHAQELATALHVCVCREYLCVLMRGGYRCSKRKQQRAATKIHHQGETLNTLLTDMGSTADWLRPLSEHLSLLIGQKEKSDIRDHLKPLLLDFPDISKRHVSAVLVFRGMSGGREFQRILSRLSELKRELRSVGNAEGGVEFHSGNVEGDQQQARVEFRTTGNIDDPRRNFFASIPTPPTHACLTHTPLSCFTLLLPHTH